MNTEIQQIWQEVLADYSSPVALWQLLIIVGAVGLSLLLNGAIRAYLLKNASDQLKPLLGGINRVLFPITTFLFVGFARLGLDHWGVHVGILRFACRLLLAMAAIRLIVYALRYIFSPSGWLKALEHVIAWAIWGMLALHLSGFLSQIVQVLEDVQFNVGKNSVNLLIILQGILTVIFTIFIALWLSRLLENKLMRANEVSLNM
ncbi:MAG TPA: mechanosensitive ion channel protein MscS, partial [Methylophilaceae bacterium]|nr:mechanosensitive ion channel protein MscS [Methylophilaceae bacterium]